MVNAREELTKVLNGFNVQLEDNKNVIETKDRNCFTDICNALTDKKIPFVGYGYGETAEDVTYGMKILEAEKSESEDNMNMNSGNGQTMFEKKTSLCKTQCCSKAGCSCSKNCLQKSNKHKSKVKFITNNDDVLMENIKFGLYDDNEELEKLAKAIVQGLGEYIYEYDESSEYKHFLQLVEELTKGECEISSDKQTIRW